MNNRTLSKRVFVSGSRFWPGLLLILIMAALFACRPLTSETADGPVDVVFESPFEEIVGGVRLAEPENEWDGYGEAVDVRDDVLVIGASEWNYARDGRGTAYVYRFRGGEWQEEARLTASDRYHGQFSQRFGNAVALGEGTIAVGAPGTDPPETGVFDAGAVYVYEYDGQSWIETAKLMPDGSGRRTAQPGAEWLLSYGRMRPRSFGALVALDGDTLAVGGDSATDSVTVFQRGENGWREEALLEIPGSPGRDLYMTSLALFEDTLALSALYVPPQEERGQFLTGNVAVYVFERAGDTWEEALRFMPEGDDVDLHFLREVHVGASVALGGTSDRATLLAVGLAGFPDASGIQEAQGMENEVPDYPESQRETGAVAIFERSEDGDWKQTVTLMPAGGESPPGPGFALSGNQGAPYQDEVRLVAHYVFPGHWLSENPEITFFGAAVDVDGDRLAVTAGYANATYVFERPGEEWLYRFKITPGREEGEFWVWEDFAQVVAISGDTLLLGTPGEFGNSAHVFSLPPRGNNR